MWLEFGLGIALPAFLTVMATVAVVFLALSRMTNEVNQIDRDVVRRSLSAAVAELSRQTAATQKDYANWNAAVTALYGAPDPAFVKENIVASTAAGDVFDTAFLLEADGRTVFGYSDGKPVEQPAAGFFKGGFQRLVGRTELIDPAAPVPTGIFMTPKGIVLAAVGAVLPSDGSTVRPKGPPRLLLVGRTLDDGEIRRIETGYAIGGLALTMDQTGAGFDLTAPDGGRIATLSATPRHPGDEAYDRARTPMMVVLGLLMLVMIFLVATIWKTLSAMHRGEELARREAGLDGLSGLPNRASFHTAVEQAVGGEGHRTVTVLFADLDGFKDVNDTYGHETGDRLIRAVAAGFASLVGPGGYLARLGGDEFAVVSTGPDSPAVAGRLGAALIDLLSEPFDFDGRVVQVGTSVGIANTVSERLTASELVRRADVAMYQAKSRGKNRVETYDPDMDGERTERAKLAVALRNAFLNEELQVHYQPVIDARTGRIVSVEALLRWIRAVDGPVSPAVFIPIAEEIGLIEDLGSWVLRRACRDAAAFEDLRVAVNISAAQFSNPGFDQVVARVLAEEGFPASRLELDITESYLVAYPERARRMIDALRALGVRIALDDFGTGFSSIGYLRRFAFDKVKIDRSVVLDVLKDPASQKLVQATVALADALGVGVTAEGIEQEDEAVILKEAGCQELQGYHFGSPTTAAEIARRMTSSRQALMRRSA